MKTECCPACKDSGILMVTVIDAKDWDGVIERCDACQVYPDDESARKHVREMLRTEKFLQKVID